MQSLTLRTIHEQQPGLVSAPQQAEVHGAAAAAAAAAAASRLPRQTR